MGALTRGRRAFTAAALTAATAVLLGAAGLVAGGSGDARAAGGAVVLDEGEVDLTPRQVDGKPQLQIDDRTGDTPVTREPSEVVLHVTPSTLQHTPSPLAESFGLLSHDTWQLNGQQSADLFALEPGWTGSEAGGKAQVELSAFDGPAVFGMATFTFAMENNDEPPAMYLGSADPAPRAFTLDGGTQRHTPTWMFDSEGVYRLTFTVTVGGATDTETLAVVVGDDVDPADVLPGDGSPPTATPTDSAPTSPSPTAPAPVTRVIAEGHVDMAARPVDGKLRFQLKEGTSQAYKWYEPDEVVLHVRPSARRKIPAGYEFLGTAGDAVWWLPLQQRADLVWPGWNTEGYAKADLDGRITFRLDSVQGPGNLAMFYDDSLGVPVVPLNSGDGLPDSHSLGAGTHSHFNWTFAAEGVYRTTFTVSSTLADGRKVSDSQTLTWVVGDDVDPSTVKPGAGDEPTATPTSTASASPSVPNSSSPQPSSPEQPSVTPTNSPDPSFASSGGMLSGGGANGAATGGGSVPDGTPGGRLASTGTGGAGVLAGAAVAALLAGGGAVFAVRRRRAAK